MASPRPFSGTFTLYYGATLLPELQWDATAKSIQDAITPVLPPGRTVQVAGISPLWRLIFQSPADAAAVTVGSSNLLAPLEIGTHLYPSGSYAATLVAVNYRYPVPDSVRSSVALDLTTLASKTQLPIIFGPILPLDTSSPSEADWSFDTATDLKVLESSLKMIVATEPGERLMEPNYGCALRQFIYAPIVPGIVDDIQSTIRQAIETWEPRVEIQSLAATRDDEIILVTLVAASKLDRRLLNLNLTVAR